MEESEALNPTIFVPVPPGYMLSSKERIGRLRDVAGARGLGALIVFADREHSGNLSWLSGSISSNRDLRLPSVTLTLSLNQLQS